MHYPATKRCISMQLTALLCGSACILDPDVIGATLSRGETTAPADATTAGPDEALTTGTGAPLAFGEPCLLIDFAYEESEGPPPEPPGPHLPENGPALSSQPDCAGGACLFPVETDLVPCDDDADCPGDEPGKYAGCGAQGFCALAPTWVAERTRCTETCEQDADCPAHESCPGGFTCAPIARLGPLCCQSLCVCTADISAGALEQVTAECSQPDPCPS